MDLMDFAILLGRLEYGFAAFYMKMADRALEQGLPLLHKGMQEKGLEESKHAKMLLSISSRRAIRPHHEVHRPGNLHVFRWGRDRDGNHQLFEGISKRYLLASLYFGGATADSFDWANTLGFMLIGEEFGCVFYRVLAIFSHPPLRNIAKKISLDESRHNLFLWEALIAEIGKEKAHQIRDLWRWRAIKAIAVFTHIYIGGKLKCLLPWMRRLTN